MNSCIKNCYFYNMKDYIKKFTDQIDEAIKIIAGSARSMGIEVKE